MEDRIPTPGQEGRMLIEPENGSAPFYAKLTMADNPTNPGTPLNKETLLQDSTEISLFGSSANRTVDEAFSGIASVLKLVMSDVASITLTVKDQAGNPVKDVLVSGIVSEEGQAVYTNTSGVASGYVAEGSAVLSISGYADIEEYSETFSVVKGSSYTKTWTVTRKNFVSVTSSQSVKFSGNVPNIDYTLVGGGQAGGNGWDNGGGTGASGSGCGGYGGSVVVKTGVPVSANTAYPAVIGAGGNGVTSFAQPWVGNPGGASTFMGDIAQGGNGVGQRRTDIGDGFPGAVGTAGYSSYTDTTRYGGGGGSGGYRSAGDSRGSGGLGGADTGAAGGTGTSFGTIRNGSSASPNTGGGGGGGAYYIDGGGWHSEGSGGAGGSGILTIRIHFDFGELAA